MEKPNVDMYWHTIPIRNTSCNSIFNEHTRTSYPKHITVFTDGSKPMHSPSVRAACILSQLNWDQKIVLPKDTSSFTAECAAMELAVNLANQNPYYSYLICTDSYSLIQSLLRTRFEQSTNKHIVSIKMGLKSFQTNAAGNSITLMWIPAHTGITGNELPDKAAKQAATQTQNQSITIPQNNILQQIQCLINQQIEKHWLEESTTKGTIYFNNFYIPTRKPWFHNKNLPRHLTV
ncbi:hypothetical protein ANTQUA_LOCUS6627 [Anthophora quadrimaculata]